MHPFSPSTPMSDKDRISPYNIKTMLSRQVMRVRRKLLIRRSFVDLTPNSQYYNNFIVDSKS